MRLCSYGRKSVYSDHSDSIDNQFRMNRDWVNFRFPDQVECFVEYSDEAFTGANTDRPGLQQMLADIEGGLYDALVVYQLDRLSRDVRDFANIYAMLERHHVMFVSIKENIDTTTPIGRAMMYVTVVFAQMERENIAARVSDNMLGLAKKGFWTGGVDPCGYKSQRVTVGGKNHCVLVVDPEGAEYLNQFFDEYLENGYTLHGIEKKYRRDGIRTRSGNYFSATTAYNLLTMPWPAAATPEIYDFYASKGCQMETPRDLWDGKHGVMVYGKFSEKGHRHVRTSPSEWTVCVGLHEPIIDANRWLAAQEQIAKNKMDKTTKYDPPLLKGVLRCSCGSTMAVGRKKNKSGGLQSWYRCNRRIRLGASACSCSQISTQKLDSLALDIFREIAADPAAVKKYAHVDALEGASDVKPIQAKISSCEGKIGRLAANLALADGSVACKYIVAEMERLDAELRSLQQELLAAQTEERKRQKIQKNTHERVGEIEKLISGLDGFSAVEKNMIAREILQECVWDGERLFLKL